MKDHKTLIYMRESDLAPVGGPRGYLYNLKVELDKRGIENISFVKVDNSLVQTYKTVSAKLSSGPIKTVLNALKNVVKYGRLIYGHNMTSAVELNEYDYVHFHSTYDMYSVRDSLESYSGKVILTSHSPKLFSLEENDRISNTEKKLFWFIYKKLIRMDEYAFDRADYLVFPCPEAEEPYYHSWKNYRRIKERKQGSYYYVLTGVPEAHAFVTKEEIRKKLNIPDSAFVISYVGRHNEVKGYDRLKEIAASVLQDENTYIVVAGREGPIPKYDHPRWIEVGWTKDPHSYIAASDVFVLPNRETYFDLVLLEVLSLGQIVVASNTGGNKFFSKFQTSGIRLFDSVDDAVSVIRELTKTPAEALNRMRIENHKLYSREFTCKVFADNYIDLYDRLP